MVAAAVLSGCEKNSSTDTSAADSETASETAPASAKVAEQPTHAAAAEHAEGKDDSCAGRVVDGDDEDGCGRMDDEEKAGGCNQWDEAAAKVIERDVPQNATWTTLKVTGMTCGGCERRVIAKVGALDGVYSVEADAELGQVRVAMDNSKPKLAELATETINKLGYRVQ